MGQLEASTGIIGLGFLLTIIHALFISTVFFIFEGEKWRFFYYSSLRAFLTSFVIFFGGAVNFFVLPVIVIIGFVADLLFNTVYEFFNKRNKKLWWGILATLATTCSTPLTVAILLIFFSPATVPILINMYLLMSPVIIIESIVGGYTGYKIYQRTKKLLNNS
jgi:hypothetical protein